MKKNILLFVLLASICSANGQVKYHQIEKDGDISMSSLVDPEQTYSYSKALGDVGFFPNSSFHGAGIKIGIIDGGLPSITTNFSNDYYTFGDGLSFHASAVGSIIGGDYGISPEATLYFASTNSNSFNECLDWLINTKHVDVINHSAGNINDQGYYNYSESLYIDKKISQNEVHFVNALGNTDQADFVPPVALGLNVITVGACDKNLNAVTSMNVTDIKEEYEGMFLKPTFLAPGKDLYGITNICDNEIDDEDASLLSGTSFSAPITTGIISLLLEEFPNLKGKPHLLNSILSNSCNYANNQTCADEINGFGIINYQKARKVAQLAQPYTLLQSSQNNLVIKTGYCPVGLFETLNINTFTLFNDLTGHLNSTNYVYPNEICFSSFKISLFDSSSNLIVESDVLSNYSLLTFTNYGATNLFYYEIQLIGNKFGPSSEKVGICTFITSSLPNASLTINENYTLDTVPSFYWSFASDNQSPSSTYSVTFLSYRKQILFVMNVMNTNNIFALTRNEWETLIGLRGREYYAFITHTYISQQISFLNEYSCLYVFQEPEDFLLSMQIKPQDYDFEEQYFFDERQKSLSFSDGLVVNTTRKRCGYIEDMYINLSPKRTNAGIAYLRLEFNRPIYQWMFGVTLWNSYELSAGNHDTAIVKVKNAEGTWTKFLDLINDVQLPNTRKQVDRYSCETSAIYGLEFYAASAPTGSSNKGRLCIDDIVLNDDPSFSGFLSTFYEPIVVRKSFTV